MPDKETKFRAEVGTRLRRVREALGLDQGQVARILGVHANAVSQYEGGKRRFDPELACKLRTQWGVPLDYFYVGDVSRLPRDIGDGLERIEDESPRRTSVIPIVRASKKRRRA